jgi:hypothetical protein
MFYHSLRSDLPLAFSFFIFSNSPYVRPHKRLVLWLCRAELLSFSLGKETDRCPAPNNINTDTHTHTYIHREREKVT